MEREPVYGQTKAKITRKVNRKISCKYEHAVISHQHHHGALEQGPETQLLQLEQLGVVSSLGCGVVAQIRVFPSNSGVNSVKNNPEYIKVIT